MREDLLHYIWKYQHFDTSGLSYMQEPVIIFNPGYHNHNAGPDFKDAHVKIGEIEWRGSVEIHVRSSEWKVHGHTEDPAYNNTILHVVWQNNADVSRNDGTTLPFIELKNRVSLELLQRYDKLSNAPYEIPCKSSASRIPEIKRLEMIEKAAVERIEHKSAGYVELLHQLKGDWEECAYRVLLRAFGFNINQEVASRLAEQLPLKVLKLHASNQQDLEALLFGQAGLLSSEAVDEYMEYYQNRYQFLKTKFELSTTIEPYHWKKLRLRPANFPAVRLAQFAALIRHTPTLFERLTSFESYKDLQRAFRQPVSDYWNDHYDFGKKRKKRGGTMGQNSLDLLIINAVVPLLATYGQTTDQTHLLELAVNILSEMKPEQNRKTRKMTESGFQCKNAMHSQGLLALFDQYCVPRKCLRCTIGNHLLKRES